MDQATNKEAVNSTNDKILDLRVIVLKYLSYWSWFIVSTLFFSILGFIYIKQSNPIYENKVIVLLKDENTASDELVLLQDLGVASGKNNIENEVSLFKSPDLALKAVTSLELYTTYRKLDKWGFNDRELYENAPLYLRWEDVEPEKIPGSISFTFKPQGSGYSLVGKYKDMDFHGNIDSLPVLLKLPMGRFYISANSELDPEFVTQPYEFTVSIVNPASLARSMADLIEVAPSSQKSSVLTLVVRSEISKKGRDYLEHLIKYYNEDATNDKNKVAYNTAVFIDERIKEISSELGTVEQKVEDFRQSEKITNITAESELFLEQTGENEQKRLEVETQLNLIRFVEDFIRRDFNADKLIPNLGVNDAGLVAVINDYNKLLIRKDRLQSSSSADNPALIQMQQEVSSMRQTIQASLANVRRASEISLQQLNMQYTVTNTRIQNIPKIERQYKDIMRQQEVKNNLFVFLLQKREETALTQAAVAPKAKIVSRPYTPDKPVAPQKALVLGVFFLFGLFLPISGVFIRDLFHTTIESLDDLVSLQGIDVIGDIPKLKGSTETMVVKENDDSPVVELFRTLRNNLLFMINEQGKQVIMVTSTVPGEGKTFISINLARILSLMNKKVLLMGGDIRNPQISKSLGIPRSKNGLTSYLAGLEKNYSNLITNLFPNLDLLQSGSIPPNPNELLSNHLLEMLFVKLRSDYDYIIIDSAPVGVISDSFVLNRIADLTLYVMRERVTQKDTVSYINSIKRDNRLNSLAVVLNGSTPQGKYGNYKYGYKFSHRYGYKASYGYKNKSD